MSLGLVRDNDVDDDDDDGYLSDRRSAISIIAALPLIASSIVPTPPANAAADKGKVVVFGGSGWVGTHVCKYLTRAGYDVVSVSRTSPDLQVKRVKTILAGTPFPPSSSTGPSSVDAVLTRKNKRGGWSALLDAGGDDGAQADTTFTIPGVQYVSLNAITASEEDLAAAVKGSVAVVSTVGISPTKSNKKEGNSVPNARIAKAAKSAGVKKFVYIGVATSVSEGSSAKLVADYLEGKADAERSITQEFGDKALIIKPSSVSGGTPGEIRPPAPPGPLPVPVYALAKVVVDGVSGGLKGVVDGNEAIVAIEGCQGKKGCDF